MRHQFIKLLVASSTIALLTTTAFAQDQVASEDAVGAGEIVVTAQKRTERLIEVPLAVTAVSGESLTAQNINDSQSLARSIPSLSYQQGGAPNNSSFRVRGIGTSLFGQGVEPSVSVVVDGVVTARAGSGFSELADIERVEVLRGPQGTLFGKNATAGVINIVTARPTEELSGRVEATIAEHDEYRLKGTISGPLGDGVRARLSGYYNDVAGHLNNLKDGKRLGGNKSWGLRGKLDLDASDDLTFKIIGDYRDYEARCCGWTAVRIANPAFQTILGPVTASPTNRTVNNDGLDRVFSKLYSASVQADWDIGPATITSITAYQGYKERNDAEVDGAPTLPVPAVGSGALLAAFNAQTGNQKQDNYTQELRIASNGNSDFTYVAGIFLGKLDLHRDLNRRVQLCSAGVIGQPCAGTITNLSSAFTADFSSKTANAFGQVDWRVAGGFHVLGGLRVQNEKQRVTGAVINPFVAGDGLFPGPVPNSGTSRRSDTAWSGKAGIRYEFSRNAQAYASYTRGYKAFALDLGATTRFDNNPGLSPEHVDAYELGFKFRTSDGMFDLNAAVFQSKYNNLQTQTVIQNAAGGFVVQQINAGKSETKGFELEGNLRPTDTFSIGMSFSYVDATIDIDGLQCALQQRATAPTLTANFPINSCHRKQVGANLSPQVIDVRGGNLPVSPKYRIGISPRWEVPIGDKLKMVLQSNINFQSRSFFSLDQDPLLKQNAYTLVDVSAGIGDIEDRYKVTFFVRNLFNENYYTNLFHNPYLSSAAQPFDLVANVTKDSRRYFGATLNAKF